MSGKGGLGGGGGVKLPAGDGYTCPGCALVFPDPPMPQSAQAHNNYLQISE